MKTRMLTTTPTPAANSGTLTQTVVPRPRDDSTVMEPPTRCARSRMPTSPSCRSEGATNVEPLSVILDDQADLARVSMNENADRLGRGVFVAFVSASCATR